MQGFSHIGMTERANQLHTNENDVIDGDVLSRAPIVDSPTFDYEKWQGCGGPGRFAAAHRHTGSWLTTDNECGQPVA